MRTTYLRTLAPGLVLVGLKVEILGLASSTALASVVDGASGSRALCAWGMLF